MGDIAPAGSSAVVKIKNKDIPLLTNIFYIMQEIQLIERRRQWQQERMFHITQHLTGMPGGGNSPKGLDESFALLSEIDDEHTQLCKKYARQLRKAQQIINSIESQSMRTFVNMKYVMNVPDVEIRNELNLTRRGFERARRAVEEAPSMADVRWQERYILVKDDE